MWRTVIVSRGEKLSLRNSRLVVNGDPDIEIPIEDIYSVLIDNRQTFLTVGAMTALTDAGVHLVLCNEKHVPVSLLLPLNTHYRAYNVLRKQIDMEEDFKDSIWQKVVQAKISNQAHVLKIARCSKDVANHLIRFSNEVVPGDLHNREGLAAKMFFKEIYGSGFIRMEDDVINAALNYGYTIIRSAVSKTLTAYGYNCALGIHHIGDYNAFNLADDMMEPLRPIVDLWVDKNKEDLFDELTKQNRNELVGLVNCYVLWDNKKTRLRYAIDKFINSFTTCIERRDANKLKIPLIIGLEKEDREDE
jgi:CRISPR-associated protein Cas1